MNNHDGTATHTAHGGGFLPADAGRGQRRAARKAWRAAAQGLVADDIDRAAAAKRAENDARNAEYRSRTPKAGEKRPWAGRTARPLRVRQHRATTASLSFAYPFLADGGLGSSGIYIGRDSHSGASFCYCGFDLYNRRPRLVSNTNVLIAGNIGWGKTNTAMAIAVRRQGRRTGRRGRRGHRDRRRPPVGSRHPRRHGDGARPGNRLRVGHRHRAGNRGR